ncbi:MAG: hypothetical protein FJX77_16160 [Armatimonadetes bacterium]|nr:hypothetical protein [Armatimonadota bacterium]
MQPHPGGEPFAPHTAHCRNHPGRQGIGVCVRCRAVICLECTTRIAGINHCTQCLEAAGDRVRVARQAGVPQRAVEILSLVPLAVLAAAVAVAAFYALAFGMAMWQAASPGGLTSGS